MSLGCWCRRLLRGRNGIDLRLRGFRRVGNGGGGEEGRRGFCVGFEGRSRGRWGDEVLHVWVDGTRQEGDRKVRAVHGFLETHVHDCGGAPSLGAWEMLRSPDGGGGVCLCNPGKSQMEGDHLWELCAFRIQDMRLDETAAVYGSCRPYVVGTDPGQIRSNYVRTRWSAYYMVTNHCQG